jgi:hypothetical protein
MSRFEFRNVELSDENWISKLNGFGSDGFEVVTSVAGQGQGGSPAGTVILQKTFDD